MTIRQQGGVFGRNPSFNDVDANSVSATSISTNTISEKTSGNGVVVDGVTLKDNAVLAPFGVDVTQGRYKSAFFGNPVYMGGAGQMNFGAGGNDLILGTTNAPIRFGSTSTNTEWARITSVGLVLPNGKGIDFSATSGTGTSELFDDYEEGSYTPALGSGVSTTSSTGLYTKIGNRCFFTADFTVGTTSNTGAAYISLPFSTTASAASAAGGQINWTDYGAATYSYILESNNRFYFRSSTGGTLTYANISGKRFRISGNFEVA
jgi:hypothetical protein